MQLHEIETALDSLSGWPRVIGCMGGEPTLHPDFEEVCRLYRKKVGFHRSGLWTSGGPAFNRHEKIIRSTFRTLLYNDHSTVGKHHPWMIAIDDVIEDEDLKNELIDNCWVQKLWSPVINPKGAFFCEIAAVIDLLFDGPGGYPVDKEWWHKAPKDFADQRERYCGMCGMALPWPHIPNDSPVDYVSMSNYERLLKAKSPWVDRLHVVEDRFSKDKILEILANEEYVPWEYLGEDGTRDKKGRVKAGYAAKRHHIPLSKQGVGCTAQGIAENIPA